MNQLLRDRRTQALLTQEELARRVGVTEQTVRRWEAGRAAPQPGQLRKLCEALDASPAQLGFQPGVERPSYGERLMSPAELTSLLVRDDDELSPAVRRSRERWREIRRLLAEQGANLVPRACDLYGRDTMIGTSEAIAHPSWIMPEPVDIRRLTLDWSPAAPAAAITGTEPEARLCLPLHSPGHQYDRYSTAVRHIDRPRLFENRASYRLHTYRFDEATGVPSLGFGLGTYFDKVDVSETLVHEFAAAYIDRQHRGLDPSPTWEDLPFRALVGDPFEVRRRPTLPGVLTLTLRRPAGGGDPSMLLHLRDPSLVAIGGRVHTLIPSGEFQPSSIAPASLETDLDLWRNIVREYSEELLDMPEHDGSHGAVLDYDRWPLYRTLTAALQEGRVRVYFLGMACNPLSLGTDLLTVAVFEDETFEAAFPAMRRTNSEGVIVTDNPSLRAKPLMFDQGTATELLDHHRLAPSSAACLQLAWRHRAGLLEAW